MFPIRRPCADAVRSGIFVLWSNGSSALYSSCSTAVWLTSGRRLIKQVPGGSRLLLCTRSQSCGVPAAAITQGPPALNQVLREYGTAAGTKAKVGRAGEGLPPVKSGGKEGDIKRVVKYAANPKGKERDIEADGRLQENRIKEGTGSAKQSGGAGGGGDFAEKPGKDRLLETYNILQKSLERTFTHPMDYSIYSRDVVFIDNIRHIRTQGLEKYIQQVAMLKIVGHVKFAYVRFEILNMSMCQEEGRITVRWRIKGLSGLRVMLKFWKFKLWRWQEMMKHQETWHDGISYFEVGGDGKIFQHVADKVMEDKDRSIDDKPGGSRTLPFAAKLGGALGATRFPTPAPSLSYQSASNSSTTAAEPTPAPVATGDGGGGGGANIKKK